MNSQVNQLLQMLDKTCSRFARTEFHAAPLSHSLGISFKYTFIFTFAFAFAFTFVFTFTFTLLQNLRCLTLDACASMRLLSEVLATCVDLPCLSSLTLSYWGIEMVERRQQQQHSQIQQTHQQHQQHQQEFVNRDDLIGQSCVACCPCFSMSPPCLVLPVLVCCQ